MLKFSESNRRLGLPAERRRGRIILSTRLDRTGDTVEGAVLLPPTGGIAVEPE